MIPSSIDSVEELDGVCYKCCFEIDYNQKTTAEEMVSLFVKDLVHKSEQI